MGAIKCHNCKGDPDIEHFSDIVNISCSNRGGDCEDDFTATGRDEDEATQEWNEYQEDWEGV